MMLFSFFLFFCLTQIASLLKIPFLDEEVGNNSFPRKVNLVFLRKLIFNL